MILHPRHGYDRWAEVYDTNRNSLIALDDDVFGRLFCFTARGRRAVDLGCGTGRVTAKLVRLGARVTAVDLSEGMISRARGKFKPGKVEFVTADMTGRLPFSSNRFHLAIACLVLEHIRDKKKFLSEVFRILTPGGILYLSEMHPAMALLGNTANLTDPKTGREIRPRSYICSISDLAMAALGAGFNIHFMKEYSGRKGMLKRYPKVARYVDWPMLAVMVIKKPPSEC